MYTQKYEYKRCQWPRDRSTARARSNNVQRNMCSNFSLRKKVRNHNDGLLYRHSNMLNIRILIRIRNTKNHQKSNKVLIDM